MSRATTNQAFWVAREGGEGQAVLAAHPLSALVEVITAGEEGEGPTHVEATRRGDGWAARVDGEVWTVRPHRPAIVDAARSGIEGAADVTAACERALAAAREVVPSESGAVLLLEGRYLRFVLADGPQGASLVGVRLPATTGVVGYAVQTQRPQIVSDATMNPRHYRALDDITGYETRQILAVPAVHGGVVMGVIELMNPPGADRFDEGHAARIERIARVLATWLAARRRR